MLRDQSGHTAQQRGGMVGVRVVVVVCGQSCLPPAARAGLGKRTIFGRVVAPL